MIPIGDDNSQNHRTPVVTRLLLAMNIAVFILLQQCGSNPTIVRSLGAVPQELLEGRDITTADQIYSPPTSGRSYRIPGLLETPVWVYATILTAMFLHGSLGHLFGNMLYLGIFGDNVENRLGPWKYLIFYLVMGTAATAAQTFANLFSNQGLLTPMIGASGAISGILGAYLVLFPRNRVYLLTFGFFPLPVSAWFALAVWFFLQLGSAAATGPGGGGVAYAAHIGGFVAGWLWASIYKNRDKKRRDRAGRDGDVRWRIVN